MSAGDDPWVPIMLDAVEHCIEHVARGGLPFVGVVVGPTGEVSAPGVNRFGETGDPSAHAEVEAMRDVLRRTSGDDLRDHVLLATGEPCGLCYRFALDHGIETVLVAVDRDEVARWGFDYRASYAAFGVSDEQRSSVLRTLPVPGGHEPFATFHRTTTLKGTPS